MRCLKHALAIICSQISETHLDSRNDRQLHLEVLEEKLPLTTISGSVFNDIDRNGFNFLESPIAGETVHLLEGVLECPVLGDCFFPVDQTITTSSFSPSNYSFESFTPGIYQVRFNPSPGWQVTTPVSIGEFSVGPVYDGELGASWVATGLLDDNLSLDFVVANSSAGTLSLFYNNGEGSSFTSVVIPVGGQVSEVAVADFNGDGFSDLAVAHPNLTYVSLLINDGQGGFPTVETLSTGGIGPRSLAIADFDEDGFTDIVALNAFSDDLAVLINDGANVPSFTLQSLINLGGGSIVAAARLQPGRAYNLILSGIGSGLTVYSNDGSGLFTFSQNVALPDVVDGDFNTISSSPINLSVGDIDHDGVDDVAMASAGGSIELTVLFGDGLGGLDVNSAQLVMAGRDAGATTAADVDGDGDLDLVARVEGGLAKLLNVGERQFHNGQVSIGQIPGSFASPPGAGDFNGDGRIDLVYVYDDFESPFPLVIVEINNAVPGYTFQIDGVTPVAGLNLGLAMPVDSADFDGNNVIDGADFLAWQLGFGTPFPNATKADGDADNDLDVDDDDLRVWEAQYLLASIPPSADFDGNSVIDGFDFLAWQLGLGTPSPNATKADGDADNDLDVDNDDLTVWETQYGQSAPLAAASSSPQVEASSANERLAVANVSPLEAQVETSEQTMQSDASPESAIYPLSIAGAKDGVYTSMGMQVPPSVSIESRLTQDAIKSSHNDLFASAIDVALAMEWTGDRTEDEELLPFDQFNSPVVTRNSPLALLINEPAARVAMKLDSRSAKFAEDEDTDEQWLTDRLLERVFG